MPGRTRRAETTTGGGRAHRRWLFAAGAVLFGGLLGVAAEAATQPAYAARASIAPKLYYIGDSAGSVYTFTVKNTGTTTSIGAVEITRPATWTITSCPTPPAGWTATASATRCRFRSAASKGDDIKPGLTKTFHVKAKTDPGTANRTGTWPVAVSSTNHFDTPSALKAASPTGAGLTTTLYTFELTTAVVADVAPLPGTACPAAGKDAVLGSNTTIVVCGKNRASTALTPSRAYSTLAGTFVKTPGTFASAPIARNSANVVLANWTATTVSDVYGANKKVIAGIGASANRRSPLRTFTGYSALSRPPVAVNDARTTAEDTPLVVAAPGVLDNDSDPDHDAVTARNVTSPANGTVTMAPEGGFTYTPNADFHGTDSFTYTAYDTHSDSAPATVTITVTPVNDAPTAVAQSATTAEDTAKALTLAGADVDGDPLTYSIVSGPAHGSLGAVVADAVTYTPDADFHGTDSFTYTSNDGTADSAPVTVSITVDAVNDAPLAGGDAYSTNEDTALVVAAPGVLGDDSDSDGDALAAELVTGPAHGTLSLNGDGSFTYTPAGDYHGADAFSYVAKDGAAGSAPATVALTVSPVNDAPTAGAVAVSTAEDTGKAVTLAGADVDGDPLTYSIVSGPSHGSLGAVVGDSVTYTPDADYHGTDSFTFEVNDGTVDSAAGTVTVTVGSVNDVPVAGDDAYSTDEDTALVVAAPGVLGDDSDTENGPLSAVLDARPAHGTVTLNPDGSFTYAPTANYHGADSFTYRANDGTDDSSAATVDITVGSVNDLPTASNQMTSTDEETAKAVTLSGSDVEGAVTYAIVTGPAHGSLGALVGDSVTYTPDADYFGADSFTFKVTDGSGADSAAATVDITVNGVNDAPVAGDDAYSTDEDTALVVAAPGVLGDDGDADPDTLTAALVSGVSHGTLTLSQNGSFTYTPAANYAGADSFTYRANDGTADSATATVALTVRAVNDVPVASDLAVTTAEDTAKAVTMSGSDVESAVTYAVVTGPAHGSLGGVAGDSVTYTPGPHFNGTDSFTYKVNDGTADSAVGTVTVTVTAVDDAPVAGDDGPFQTFTDTNIVLPAPGVLTNDMDVDGQALTAGNASGPAHGSVTLQSNGSFSYTPDLGYTGTDTFTYDASDGTLTDSGTVTIRVVSPNATPTAADTTGAGAEDGGAIVVALTGTDADGNALTFTAGTATNGTVTVPGAVDCATTANTCTTTVTYTPNRDFTGTDTFTYKTNDGTVDSAPGTATITVSPVNDAPSFTKGGDQTVAEDAAAQTVSGWATAISAGPANESAQTVSFTATAADAGLFAVPPTVTSAGVLSYTPAANANGSTTVTVQAYDDGGTADGGVATSPTQTFTITVTAVNDAPSFTKGADQTVNEDAGAQSVSNWATAISKGPADESAQSLAFTTSNDNNALFSVQPGVTSTGTLVYTAAPNAVGSATVTITLSDTGGTANTGDDTSDAQTFTVTVNGVNDEPSFTDAGDQTVLEDAGARTVPGFVTGTSAGPADESAQTVTVSVTGTTNGALFAVAPAIDASGALTYTPAANANGSAVVTAVATDDGGTANGGDATGVNETFTITVTPVNDAPGFTKGADQTLNEDAGAQSVSNWATAISKGPANESAQTVSFTVTNDNTALFASQPAIGSTGTLTYTSAANKYGTATVSVAISDNGGTANSGDDTSDVQTFTVTVNPVNDAPVAAAKSFTVQANMKISLSGLLTGATDPNDVAGDAAWSPRFTVGSVTAGAGCVGCTISNIDSTNGTFDFDPPAGGTGTYSVTYTVVDDGHPMPGATSAPQTITFTVGGPVVWFVDADGAAGGTGRLSAPFNTLAAATTAMGTNTNQRIFVEDGNVTGNVTLQSAGWLISDAVTGTSLDSVMAITPPPGTIARPAINQAQRTLTGTVTVGTDSTVRGFNLTPASGSKGLVGSGKTGLTVNQMSISTTNARAVDLANSSGTFALTRVDANGADRGISLVNTNTSTGSFTVSGSGTAGSGGTVTASTATGGTTFGGGDGGIYLNNTKNVSLTRMSVTNGQGSGVYGTDVTAFSLASSTVSGNGTDVGKDHDGVHFDTVQGTVSITGSTVTGSKENNVRFRNNSGTATITVTGSTFSNNDPTIGANGLLLDTYNGAVATFNASGNTFTSNNTAGLAVYSNSSGTTNATIGTNTLTGNQQGVDLAANGTGASTFVVDGVSVTGCATCGAPIHAYKGTGATGSPMLVTIRNNTVDNLGSELSSGIWVHGEGAGALRGTITNNRVRGVEYIGIYGGVGNGGNATMDLDINGNDVDNSAAGPNASYGIFVETGLVPGDANVTCANIAANKAVGGAGGGGPAFEGIAVQNFLSGTFRLPGFPGGADALAESYLVGNNTAPVTADASSASGSGFSGGAACNTP